LLINSQTGEGAKEFLIPGIKTENI